jgi:hypothetical protein
MAFKSGASPFVAGATSNCVFAVCPAGDRIKSLTGFVLGCPPDAEGATSRFDVPVAVILACLPLIFVSAVPSLLNRLAILSIRTLH